MDEILHNGSCRLYLGDCMELMDRMPDGCADMVLCDLPYGVTDNKWDVPLPLSDLWRQYRRVCKERAAVVLHAQEPFTSDLIQSNRKEFKYKWCWHKAQCSGFLLARKQPLRNCEDIVVFYRKQCTYNPQKRKGGRSFKSTSGQTSNYGKSRNFPHVTEYRYPTTLLHFPLQRYEDGHPTQKPVPLLEYLIRTYTNEGDTVLDNCMGSGSTGVACVNTGRRFIGIEKEERYYNTAVKRVKDALAQQTLF